jgi:hypothetical protein
VTHHRPLINGKAMWDDYLWPADYEAWTKTVPFLDGLLTIERAFPHGRRDPNGAGGAQARELRPSEAAKIGEAIPASALASFREIGAVGVVVGVRKAPAPERQLMGRLCGEPRCDRNDCWWDLTKCSASSGGEAR